jgi:hypothetical protein
MSSVLLDLHGYAEAANGVGESLEGGRGSEARGSGGGGKTRKVET